MRWILIFTTLILCLLQESFGLWLVLVKLSKFKFIVFLSDIQHLAVVRIKDHLMMPLQQNSTSKNSIIIDLSKQIYKISNL